MCLIASGKVFQSLEAMGALTTRGESPLAFRHKFGIDNKNLSDDFGGEQVCDARRYQTRQGLKSD